MSLKDNQCCPYHAGQLIASNIFLKSKKNREKFCVHCQVDMNPDHPKFKTYTNASKVLNEAVLFGRDHNEVVELEKERETAEQDWVEHFESCLTTARSIYQIV